MAVTCTAWLHELHEVFGANDSKFQVTGLPQSDRSDLACDQEEGLALDSGEVSSGKSMSPVFFRGRPSLSQCLPLFAA